MPTAVLPPAWQEVAIITVKPFDGTAREFMAITETVDISTPDYPGESIVSLAGGRIWKSGPQEDGELTLELYPVRANDVDNGGFEQYYSGGTLDTTEPILTDTTTVLAAGVQTLRKGFLVAVLWTDDVTAVDASALQKVDNKAYRRFYAKNARVISYKEDFTDKILKATVMFRFPPVTFDGLRRNFRWETTDITNTTNDRLTAITYTTTDFKK